MRKLMQWLGSHGDWTCSTWTIPEVSPEAEASRQRWTLVAGGLALVLSRLGPHEVSAHFASTQEAYALIRRRLRQSRPVDAGAQLLSDVMHEIAEVGDPVTRRGLRGCFDDAARRHRGRDGEAAHRPPPPTTQAPLTSGPGAIGA